MNSSLIHLIFFTTERINQQTVHHFHLQDDESETQYYLWYTLPWAFHEFPRLTCKIDCVRDVQVLGRPQGTITISSSRLLNLSLTNNTVSTVLALPHLISLNSIEELHLYSCDRRIRVTLPSLRHLTLTDSLDVLHDCSSISTNIRSITIVLDLRERILTNGNWSVLQALPSLPLLSSLRVILYDTPQPPDDWTGRILAETAVSLTDFSFCFRQLSGVISHDLPATFNTYRTFIKKLRRTIDILSLHGQRHEVVEKDGFGLMIWF